MNIFTFINGFVELVPYDDSIGVSLHLRWDRLISGLCIRLGHNGFLLCYNGTIASPCAVDKLDLDVITMAAHCLLYVALVILYSTLRALVYSCIFPLLCYCTSNADLCCY